MNCEQVNTELIAYIKGELEQGKRRRLEEHLARCPACRQELEEARRLLDWTEAASDEAVVNKVNEIITNAIKANASDIHFESQRDDTLKVRYRIDGVLHEVTQIDAVMRHGITTRLKMMADMNVTERRVPQDGRIPFDLNGKGYDLRATSAPFIYGENLVLRILDRSAVLIGLDKLGFDENQRQEVERLLHQPCGMLIVSGPAGSGKTTTLYSMLLSVVSPANKILTIEDPVEYAVLGVNQSQVNRRLGYTFPAAMRSFLRQDPDIIMLGEIRDQETANLCMEAALTGHLVLSSFYSDDAIGVIQRLHDMQVEPFLIAASLIGVAAQRLVRKVCSKCATDVEADPNDPILKAFGIAADDLREHKIRRGTGCEACRNTGYRGRTGIYEIFTVADKELAAMIADGATTAELAESARSKGFRSIREDGRRKILEGITTPEEVFRVLSW